MCGPIPSTPTPKVKAPPFLVWHLLAIQLVPRIRHWKELNLCHPPGEHRYLHIDSPGSESAIVPHLFNMSRLPCALLSRNFSEFPSFPLIECPYSTAASRAAIVF
jgi:hypothetical protein